MTMPVTVDVAGAEVGGAARLAAELQHYLTRTRRADVRVVGTGRRLDPAWLVHRELTERRRSRRIAFNNVSFIAPGGERWALLRSALHFLTEAEQASVGSTLGAAMGRKAAMVRWTAQRADVLVTPSTVMAERVTGALPRLTARLVVRPHPLSPGRVPVLPAQTAILCPILFSPYKQMGARITEWITAIDRHLDPAIRMIITAEPSEMPGSLARHPRIDVAGRVSHHDMAKLWARSRAIYFPTTIESFGFPLAEARANGYPVVAADTPQNREIAGPALCAYTPGDPGSLRCATERALTARVTPDPAPFDPDTYFAWLLGAER